MAKPQCNQTHPKFTWRFLAVPTITPDIKPIVLYTNASTEQDARNNCPGWMLFFAARLPLQEVIHG
ncbi:MULTISPECIES: host cell division inhibitor Icd-like protein [Enterobacter]|uniref:host cell division inhibitor Icd-like protein n=1 Tax=Enterobacter TaxID=547 RepID=UPI0020046E5F|nr:MULTISPECIES: host cell division inhibitor Icd-like protein [Enterobacter]MCK6991627.1 host cell division inhibitor Icd-like protein [Enterobacter asburiae]MCM7634251.1 host cell division inhibitor Icd-like protein [Enterobacter bugandensis]